MDHSTPATGPRLAAADARDVDAAAADASETAPEHEQPASLRQPICRDGSLSVPVRGLESWYLLARSGELKPGQVVTRHMHGREVVLYRGRESRRVFALAPHCAHMGTNLVHGTVLEDDLRCPLHHWRFGGDGSCTQAPGCAEPPRWARQRSFPVRESLGGVWVFNGPEATYGVPSFPGTDESQLAVAAAQPVEIECPWFVVAANGYDGQHFSAVHRRELLEPPRTRELAPNVFELEFVARVSGTRLNDRVMKWLSKDRITVRIVCWGGVAVTVESRLGTRRPSLLVLGMQPDGDRVRVQGLLPVPRRRVPLVTGLHKALSRWLFVAFLRADSEYLQHIRFRPRTPLPEGEPLQPFLEFLDGLAAAR
jgi:nitrite reductase/ring-hydroxylating ferredoxin subunit